MLTQRRIPPSIDRAPLHNYPPGMSIGPLLNAAYAIAAVATAPWWMRKARDGWAERFGRIDPLPPPAAPATESPALARSQQRPKRLLVHAVSVGEVNLIRPLIDALLAAPDRVQPVISATTDTGLARARALYGDRCPVVRYPLDATWAVRRFMDAVSPDAVALTELELWPNFATACARRNVPLMVINGRLSARSFKRYKLARPVLRRYFAQLAVVAAQDAAYAQRFVAMGVASDRCEVAGTMKWDAAPTLPDPALDTAAARLAEAMGIDRRRPLIVAGSTAPGEHELLLQALRHAQRATGTLAQLLCAPRRPEWFDDAASALPGCVRRSAPAAPRPDEPRDLFLLDSIGELRAAYHLADLVVVGRSLIALHGSDPMEPAALGKPVVIGPRTADFEQAVSALRDCDAIVQTTAETLPADLAALMADPARRDTLARNAARCVQRHRGATQRHLDLLWRVLDGSRARRA
jgi:3-deoxy-D-manno-octulosonic-acid transferase